MAKFCEKCGAKLDETTGLCPHCDADKLTKEAAKPVSDADNGKSAKKLAIVVIMISAIVVVAAGIGVFVMTRHGSAVKEPAAEKVSATEETSVTEEASVTEEPSVTSDGIVYEIDEETQSVTVTGYTGSAEELVVPAEIDEYPVAVIGTRAFADCGGLQDVTLSENVTDIGDYAFSSCSGMTDITFQETQPPRIGAEIFDNCNVVTIHVPNECLALYESALADVLPDSATVMTEAGETSVPEGLEYTVDTTAQCVTITGYTGTAAKVRIPKKIEGYPVTRINAMAFESCSSLMSVTIPASVTYIECSEYAAFGRCTGLTEITVDSANTEYSSQDGVLFNKDQTTLLTCPAGKNGAYTVPGSVSSIEDCAFYDCVNLTGITIPSSVTSIGDCCTFSFCAKLTAISVDAANTVYSSVDGVLFNKDQTELIAYPAGKSGTYTVPESVRSIAFSSFTGCSSLTEVTISQNVTNISQDAFASCSSLTSVTVAGTSGISDYAFANCDNLQNILFWSVQPPDFSDFAFDGCPAVTIHVPFTSPYEYEEALSGLLPDGSTIVADTGTTTSTNTENNLSVEDMRDKIKAHYTELWQPKGTYTTAESNESDSTYSFVIRYRMSDEEQEERIARGLTPLANVYVTTVYVNKTTGEVTDESGTETWNMW